MQVSPEADNDHKDLAAAGAPVDVDSSHHDGCCKGPSQVSPGSYEPSDNQKDSSEESFEESSEGGQDKTAEEDENSSTSYHCSSIDFFTDPKPQNNRHYWLVKFFEYLSRPTAGDKKESVRLQHAAQMRNLLDAIDPHGNDILCLLDHKGDAVWKLWLKPNLMEKKKKPGKINSYLTSYEKFLTFVTHKQFTSAAPAIHPDYIKDFETVKADLKGWRSTVDSQSYDARNKRFVDKSEGLLTLQELTQIKSSKMYNNAIRLIIQAGQGKELNVGEFVDVRDFLITRLSLDTGTRPGPLNNSTLEEFSAGKVKDDCKVMLVAKHKRAKNGPAICPMLPELYKFMNIYVRRIRPYFAKSEVDALFETREGLAFKGGTIGHRLSSFVEKCGVRLGSRMAFVDMQKVITQMLKKATPEEKSILRRVLAHSEKTSREWYT